MKDTKISEVLEINYDDINYVDDLLGMWAQVKVLNIPLQMLKREYNKNYRGIRFW